MSDSNQHDDIDRIVDRILARPDRAEELKGVLRSRIGTTTAPLPGRRAAFPTAQSKPSDTEAFWDNVPV